MVVDVCANRLTNWTDYVRDPERKTNLSSNEYETLKAKLNLNYRECFLLLNESFKELIEVGGFSAVDETIWAFKGLSAYSVYMERKPKDFGLRFYPWCFELTLLKRPVCYHVIPDLCTPHLTAAQIMEEIKGLWPAPHSKTEMSADSLFTTLGWIQSNPEFPITMAMAKGKIENLIPIMTKGLTVHEYRVFSKGDILLSIWMDNNLVISASNMFTFEDSPEKAPHINDIRNPKPYLSFDAVERLENFRTDDLKSLNQRIGLPMSGNKTQLAFRIAGRTPPQPISNELTLKILRIHQKLFDAEWLN